MAVIAQRRQQCHKMATPVASVVSFVRSAATTAIATVIVAVFFTQTPSTWTFSRIITQQTVQRFVWSISFLSFTTFLPFYYLLVNWFVFGAHDQLWSLLGSFLFCFVFFVFKTRSKWNSFFWKTTKRRKKIIINESATFVLVSLLSVPLVSSSNCFLAFLIPYVKWQRGQLCASNIEQRMKTKIRVYMDFSCPFFFFFFNFYFVYELETKNASRAVVKVDKNAWFLMFLFNRRLRNNRHPKR